MLFGTLIILALFDLIATISWLSAGVAEEANPIMDYLAQESMVMFAFGKLLLTFAGIFVLKNARAHRPKLVFGIAWFLVILYALLGLWHLSGILHIMA